MSKDLIAATARELESWPDTSMTQEPQGKHGKITLHYKEHSRLVVMSCTPSDGRTLHNHIATVRRELRGMVATKAHPVIKADRPHKPHVPATQKPFQALEPTMETKPPRTSEQKFKGILNAIADLRYGEMLLFAEALSAAAIETKMQRNRPHDWARMLQNVIDHEGV